MPSLPSISRAQISKVSAWFIQLLGLSSGDATLRQHGQTSRIFTKLRRYGRSLKALVVDSHLPTGVLPGDGNGCQGLPNNGVHSRNQVWQNGQRILPHDFSDEQGMYGLLCRPVTLGSQLGVQAQSEVDLLSRRHAVYGGANRCQRQSGRQYCCGQGSREPI